MRKGVSGIILIVIFIAIFTCVSSDCYAQNMLRKFGRGLANIVTGPVEILREIEAAFFDEGPAAAVTYGVVSGIYKTVLREIVGVYEVVTFPIPLPAEYMPILEPEFLLSQED